MQQLTVQELALLAEQVIARVHQVAHNVEQAPTRLLDHLLAQPAQQEPIVCLEHLYV
jgi:hypothetical protein